MRSISLDLGMRRGTASSLRNAPSVARIKTVTVCPGLRAIDLAPGLPADLILAAPGDVEMRNE